MKKSFNGLALLFVLFLITACGEDSASPTDESYIDMQTGKVTNFRPAQIKTIFEDREVLMEFEYVDEKLLSITDLEPNSLFMYGYDIRYTGNSLTAIHTNLWNNGISVYYDFLSNGKIEEMRVQNADRFDRTWRYKYDGSLLDGVNITLESTNGNGAVISGFSDFSYDEEGKPISIVLDTETYELGSSNCKYTYEGNSIINIRDSIYAEGERSINELNFEYDDSGRLSGFKHEGKPFHFELIYGEKYLETVIARDTENGNEIYYTKEITWEEKPSNVFVVAKYSFMTTYGNNMVSDYFNLLYMDPFLFDTYPY